MKKISRFSLAFCLSLLFGMTALQASNTLPTPTTTTTTPAPTVDPKIQEMTQRLEQIQAMDKSQLTAKERKALRKEVRHIKKAISGGVYISAGVLIVALILLVLLT